MTWPQQLEDGQYSGQNGFTRSNGALYHPYHHTSGSAGSTYHQHLLGPGPSSSSVTLPSNFFEIIASAMHDQLMVNKVYCDLYTHEFRQDLLRVVAGCPIESTTAPAPSTINPPASSHNLPPWVIVKLEPLDIAEYPLAASLWSRKDWDENLYTDKFAFLIDLNGDVVSKARLRDMTMEATTIWNDIYYYGLNPVTATKFLPLPWSYFASMMQTKFIEFRLAKDDYKLKLFSILKFPDWARNHHNSGKLLHTYTHFYLDVYLTISFQGLTPPPDPSLGKRKREDQPAKLAKKHKKQKSSPPSSTTIVFDVDANSGDSTPTVPTTGSLVATSKPTSTAPILHMASIPMATASTSVSTSSSIPMALASITFHLPCTPPLATTSVLSSTPPASIPPSVPPAATVTLLPTPHMASAPVSVPPAAIVTLSPTPCMASAPVSVPSATTVTPLPTLHMTSASVSVPPSHICCYGYNQL
ncbi:hypothetical protein VKT23_015095 [Stygiomarasmius scandens]|uniref:Uncharacterized protein n=1 Tax=Marasmiellus scandens TaxID=2682957 RepID=A0ABR1IYJ3_9AGAR